MNQWKNTDAVIDWFKEKKKKTYINLKILILKNFICLLKNVY